MRIICKVVRCNINSYRLGIDLPRHLNMAFVERASIDGLLNDTISINNIQWLRRYNTIADRSVSEWIENNGLSHNAGENLALLKFELEYPEPNQVNFRYIGVSSYKRVNHSRNRYIHSVTEEEITTEEVDRLWE